MRSTATDKGPDLRARSEAKFGHGVARQGRADAAVVAVVAFALKLDVALALDLVDDVEVALGTEDVSRAANEIA